MRNLDGRGALESNFDQSSMFRPVNMTRQLMALLHEIDARNSYRDEQRAASNRNT
jgi:hypothetical protein